MYYTKRLIKLALVVGVLSLLCVACWIGFNEVRGADCKEYLVNRYDLDEWKVYAISSTIYVYDENKNCGTLFFKECTASKSTEKEVIFKIDDQEITVTKSFDGEYTDNYSLKQ